MSWLESYKRDFPDLDVAERPNNQLVVASPLTPSALTQLDEDHQWAFYWGVTVGIELAEKRSRESKGEA